MTSITATVGSAVVDVEKLSSSYFDMLFVVSPNYENFTSSSTQESATGFEYVGNTTTVVFEYGNNKTNNR